MLRSLSARPGALLAAVLVCASFGCRGGDDGPPRFQLAGTVTFAGAPVPAGTIVFEPDTSRGTQGPQGIATITDGKYDTSLPGGRGGVGGHTIVRITGISGPADTGNDTPKKPLFEDFELRQELPKSNSTQDFQVPKEAGDAQPRDTSQPGPGGV
jgi:hypothetical protein